MRITQHARREARELFRSCQVDGLLDEQRVRGAVTLVLDRKPRGYLAVLHSFLRLGRIDLDRRSARVESAAALSSELQERFRADLLRLYGTGVSTAFAENAALIGGVRIRVGSDVYDGSIQRRLEDLRESF